MNSPRLVLKHPTGWFAAGGEFRHALQVLPDAAFRLYACLCGEADRHTGRVALEPSRLAQVLRRSTAWIDAALDQLRQHGVCGSCDLGPSGRGVEISDSFWPYEKQPTLDPAPGEVEYVRQIRALFLQPACVRSAFSAADEELALSFHRRQVSVEEFRRAVGLGCVRKYLAMLHGRPALPITSLRYFAGLVEEVRQEKVAGSYWDYVRDQSQQLEKRWLETRSSASSHP